MSLSSLVIRLLTYRLLVSVRSLVIRLCTYQLHVSVRCLMIRLCTYRLHVCVSSLVMRLCTYRLLVGVRNLATLFSFCQQIFPHLHPSTQSRKKAHKMEKNLLLGWFALFISYLRQSAAGLFVWPATLCQDMHKCDVGCTAMCYLAYPHRSPRFSDIDVRPPSRQQQSTQNRESAVGLGCTFLPVTRVSLRPICLSDQPADHALAGQA